MKLYKITMILLIAMVINMPISVIMNWPVNLLLSVIGTALIGFASLNYYTLEKKEEVRQ